MKKLVALCALAAAVAVPAMAQGTSNENYTTKDTAHSFSGTWTGSTWTNTTGGPAEPVFTVGGSVEAFARETWDNTNMFFHFNGQGAADQTIQLNGLVTVNDPTTGWVTGVKCTAGSDLNKMVLKNGTQVIDTIPLEWTMKRIENGIAVDPIVYHDLPGEKMWYLLVGQENNLQLNVKASVDALQLKGSYVLDPVICLEPVAL